VEILTAAAAAAQEAQVLMVHQAEMAATALRR
jgi:hypothetical protein